MKYALVLAGGLFFGGETYAACTADTDVIGDCLEDVIDAAQDTFKSEDEGERTETVREVIQRCRDCAFESFSDSMNKLSGD